MPEDAEEIGASVRSGRDGWGFGRLGAVGLTPAPRERRLASENLNNFIHNSRFLLAYVPQSGYIVIGLLPPGSGRGSGAGGWMFGNRVQ